MQQYRDTNYAAVSAALHAREAHLSTSALSERMLEAPTAEESCKVLGECGYALPEKCTLADVEEMLALARRALYREVAVLAPDKRIVEIFRLKYDYHNAKLALKAKRTGEDASHLVIDCGRYDALALLRGERGDALFPHGPRDGAGGAGERRRRRPRSGVDAGSGLL